MDNALFDTTPYGGPARERTTRAVVEPPETVAVSGARWVGISSKSTGVVHRVARAYNLVATVQTCMSACGLKVVPHTFEDHQPRPGCAKCAENPNA